MAQENATIPERIEVTVYLKNGVYFSVFVKEISVQKNGLGEIAGLEWGRAANEFPNLLHIDLKEIVAIVSTHHAAHPRNAGDVAPLGESDEYSGSSAQRA